MADTNKTIFADREENPLEKLNNVGSFFNGTDPTTYSEIELDPFTTGYAFLLWVKLPSWFEQDEDLKHFKVLTQKSMISFSGINDVELQESSQQYGFAGNDVSFATGVNRGNTDFTIGFREFSGTPITQSIGKWIDYIRDENSGIAVYPEKFNVELSARNHTGQLLYIVMRPDVTNISKDNIEKAFLFCNVYPTNKPYSPLFQYNLGDNDTPTVDVNFKGVPLMNAAVKEFAKKKLEEEILNISEDNNNGTIFLDNFMTPGDEKSKVFTSGILKEIYNKE